MQDYSKVKVGDEVWFNDVVNGKRRNSVWKKARVLKVGPKLITVEGYGRPIVFRKDTGRINDEYGHIMLVVDMDLYEATERADSAYRKLSMTMGYVRRPLGITYANILEAAKLLGVAITEGT